MPYNITPWRPTIYEYLNHHVQIRFATWQRVDNWSDKNRRALIKSIIEGIGLHKLVIGHIPDMHEHDDYMLDGGHRDRTIKAFYRNGFYINHDGCKLYFNKEENSLGENERTMLLHYPEMHMNFLHYRLDVDRYENITQNEAIEIFLRINQTGPLTVSEWLNSSIHHLITFLRDQYNSQESDLRRYLSVFCNGRTDNHEYLKQIMPYVGAYHKFHKTPENQETNIKSLWALGEPPATRTSDSFTSLSEFIEEINFDIDMFTPEYLNNFTLSIAEAHNSMEDIWLRYGGSNNLSDITMGDLLTGYIISLTGGFDNDDISQRFITFLGGCQSYKEALSDEKRTADARTAVPNEILDTAWRNAKTTLDNIPDNFITYAKSLKQNPRSVGHCHKRYTLIME